MTELHHPSNDRKESITIYNKIEIIVVVQLYWYLELAGEIVANQIENQP